MIPGHIQKEIDTLSNAQRIKFGQLISWAATSGLPGVSIPVHTYENILNMVKQMGESPISPIEPDRTVNHDWDIVSRQGTDK